MDDLHVRLPDYAGDEYEYATMEAIYDRSGEGKSTRTTLAFGDAHGWYGAEVKFKSLDGQVNGPYYTEDVSITLLGAFEADDLINLFRKVVKHHDMQQLLLGNKHNDAVQ